jgi:hypothetical protein
MIIIDDKYVVSGEIHLAIHIWPITLIACFTVDGLKSDLQKTPNANLLPVKAILANLLIFSLAL